MKKLWKADLENGFYRNPVLYTDYSDPDAIRVGEHYYMIASSFTYVPGVPVLHSKDLVNWELIGYCVKKLPFERFNRPAHGAGTWAPALRYHDGLFYAFIPLPDEGIFVATAADPAGEWSSLHCILKGKGFIDPCPLWDEDGKAYLVFAYANSRCGIKSRLSVCEIDVKAEKTLSEPVMVYDGTQANPTIEGPKFYKRNEWYYIFSPAGGVGTGWQTVLRSRSVYGPYEAKIVMHQGNTTVNGPHQGAWVDAPDGSDWFLHFQDVGAFGRIVHLQPLCWNADWPFIGEEKNGDGIGEPVETWKKPAAPEDGRVYGIRTDDDFSEKELSLIWQWQANPDRSWYSLEKEQGRLSLFCLANPAGDRTLLWNAPNALTQLLHAPEFDTEIVFSLKNAAEGDFAGAGILGHEYSYAGLCRREGKNYLLVRLGKVSKFDSAGRQNALGAAEEENAVLTQVDADRIVLKIMMRNGCYCYTYSLDGQDFHALSGPYQAEKATWTGAKFTLYACNLEGAGADGYGCYESVRFMAV